MRVHEPCSSLQERSPCVLRPYSARAIRIKACSKDRTKRLPRCARALRCLENQTCCARTRTLLKLARAFSPCVHHVGLCRSGAAIHVYTAAAPALSASRRVTKTARSGVLYGVLDVHAGIVLYRTLNKTYERTRTLLKLARALRASHRSETLSSYTCTQTQRPSSTRAIRLKACNEDRKKWRSRCARGAAQRSARAHRGRRFVRSLLHALMWIARALIGRLYGRCVCV